MSANTVKGNGRMGIVFVVILAAAAVILATLTTIY